MTFLERVVTTVDGGISCLERTEGEGPILLFAHGTGFCKEVWVPVIDELAQRISGWTAIAFDQRLHGASQEFPPDFDWWHLGADVLAVIGDRRSVVGIGHSAGAAAIAMAEVTRPGAFAAAILVEPIIFPPPYRIPASHPLAEVVRRRRRRFVSSGAAYANYHDKGLFAGWEDRALSAYVEGGFRHEAGGVVLRCEPESEAQFLLHAFVHRMWERLGELDLPVALIAGARSDTHPAEFLERQVARIRDATTEIIPDTTHFVPMEAPGVIADRIAVAVASVHAARSEGQAQTQQRGGHDL